MANLTLPVLPLTDAVLLPGMVVPVELDAERPGRRRRRPRAAAGGGSGRGAGAARAPPRRRLRRGRRPSRVIDQVGRLPGGEPAAVVRGTGRARIGRGVTGPGAALWVEATPIDEPATGTDRARELAARVQGRGRRRSCRQRGAWQVDRRGAADRRPVRAGRHRRLRAVAELEQKVELLETPDVEARLELLRRLGAATTWPSSRSPSRSARTSGRAMDKTQREFLLRQQLAAIRKELGEDEPATGRRTTAPASRPPTCPRRCARPRCARSASWSGPATSRPEAGWIRTWLDTVLELPWNDADRGHRPTSGAARAVLDADHAGPGRREGPDRRVPGGARAPGRRAGCEVVGGRGSRRRARPGRSARCGQDLARRVGRPGARPQVRPGRARRRPGRGGDPRPPAHVRRRAARPDRPGDPARPGR